LGEKKGIQKYKKYIFINYIFTILINEKTYINGPLLINNFI